MIEHGTGWIAHDPAHIVAVLNLVAVVSGITDHGEHTAVGGIRDDNGSAEGIQVELSGRETSVFDQPPHIVVSSSVASVFYIAPLRLGRVEQVLVEKNAADQLAVGFAGLTDVSAYDIAEAVVLAGLVKTVLDERAVDLIRISGVCADLFCIEPSLLRGVIEEVAHGTAPRYGPRLIDLVIAVHQFGIEGASVVERSDDIRGIILVFLGQILIGCLTGFQVFSDLCFHTAQIIVKDLQHLLLCLGRVVTVKEVSVDDIAQKGGVDVGSGDPDLGPVCILRNGEGGYGIGHFRENEVADILFQDPVGIFLQRAVDRQIDVISVFCPLE